MTRRILGRLLAVPLLATGLFAAAALPASSTPAGHHPMPPGPHRAHRGHFFGHFGVFHADIDPIPDVRAKVGFSHVRGHAVLVRFADKVAMFVELHGLAPNLPHLQHLHGFITNNKVTQASTCPTAANDTNHDGIVSTPEGANSYGPIQVSLTTSGDTTPRAGLRSTGSRSLTRAASSTTCGSSPSAKTSPRSSLTISVSSQSRITASTSTTTASTTSAPAPRS